MVSLLDISPVAKEVPLANGDTLKVFGVSAEGIGYLLTKFPALVSLLTGGKVSAAEIVAGAPEAISAIIAAGCGYINSPEAERASARIGVEDQLNILEAVIALTMPSGFGPFVDRLTGLLGSMVVPS